MRGQLVSKARCLTDEKQLTEYTKYAILIMYVCQFDVYKFCSKREF